MSTTAATITEDQPITSQVIDHEGGFHYRGPKGWISIEAGYDVSAPEPFEQLHAAGAPLRVATDQDRRRIPWMRPPRRRRK